MALQAWWDSLDSLMRVLYAIALPASTALIIQIALILVGLGHGGAPDGGADGAGFSDAPQDGLDLGGHHGGLDIGSLHQGNFSPDGGASPGGQDFAPDAQGDGSAPGSHHAEMGALRLISLSGIVSFFTVFGWSAIILYGNGLAGAAAVLAALGLGYAAMFGAAKLVQLTVRLSEDGTMDLDNAVGQTATVYIPVPPAGGGEGKVTLTFQEQFVELGAVTDAPEAIPSGERVLVLAVRKGALVVARSARPPE